MDKDVKTRWTALSGTLTYAKSSLTRKMNQETSTAGGSIPDKDATGAIANLQAIKFMQNYQTFLQKAPSWLANFESANEDVLCFLNGMVTADSEAQEKFDKYIKLAETEELFYKQKYAECHEAILFTYISNNVQTESSLSSSQTSPPTSFC